MRQVCLVKKVKALKGKEKMRIVGICDSAARVALLLFFFFLKKIGSNRVWVNPPNTILTGS